MTRNDFSQLLQKYLDDRCSNTEQRIVESWFALLDDEKRWQNMPKEEIKAIEQKLWNRLQQSIHATDVPTAEVENHSSVPVKKIFRIPIALRVAAAVFLLLIGTAVIFHLSKSKTDSIDTIANNWIRKSNETAKPLLFLLEDGSSLQLAAGTTIWYPKHFATDKRELRIEGSAFFEIKKDSSRPFFVLSQEIITRVLGTSFWVKYDRVRQQAAVEVVSGKVAVYKQAADKKTTPVEGVVLKPNEKAIFNKKEEALITTLVEKPQPVRTDSVDLEKVKTDFIYDETPLADVVKDMEDEYGISIILGNEELNNLVFTGNVSSLDYYTKLKSICKSLGATYEIKGNRILIQRR